MKILVIGSGVVGLSSAFMLSLSGAKVKLITRNPEEATSWVAGGMLAPFSEGLEGELFEFSYESLKAFPTFLGLLRDVSNQRIDFWQDGINRVLLKDEEHIFDLVKKHSRLGVSLEEYRDNIKDFFPWISDGILCVIHYKEEGWVDAQMLMDALLFSMERLGVELSIDEVIRVHKENGKISNVEGLKGSYKADFYIFSLGAWTKELFNLPISPIKGQAIKVKEANLPRVLYSRISYLIPRSRYIYIGATSEDVGFDSSVSLEGLRGLSHNAISLVPSLKSSKFISALVGFRPATPDDLPIFELGENYAVVTGHYRNGILNAPLTAKLLSDLLLKGERSKYFDAFSSKRFDI